MGIAKKTDRCLACGRSMKGETEEMQKIRSKEARERQRIENLEIGAAKKMQENIIWQEVVLSLLFPNGGVVQVPKALVASIRNGQYDDLCITEDKEKDAFLIFSEKLIAHIEEADEKANRPKIVTDLTMPTPAERGKYGQVIDITKIRR